VIVALILALYMRRGKVLQKQTMPSYENIRLGFLQHNEDDNNINDPLDDRLLGIMHRCKPILTELRAADPSLEGLSEKLPDEVWEDNDINFMLFATGFLVYWYSRWDATRKTRLEQEAQMFETCLLEFYAEHKRHKVRPEVGLEPSFYDRARVTPKALKP
jgi:hypothetical protein